METSLDKFRCLHDEAFLYINQAITQEKPEINRKDVALIMYQRGLGLLDQALCFDTEGEGAEYEKAKKMQEKMIRTRGHIEARVIELIDELAPPLNSSVTTMAQACRIAPPRPSLPTTIKSSSAPARPPLPSPSKRIKLPSYTEAIQTPDVPPTYEESSRRHQSFLNVESELEEIATEALEDSEIFTPGAPMPRSGSNSSLSEHGEVVLSIPQVQIFHISPSGEVTTPSYPETLYIIKFVEDVAGTRGLPQAFIEVGDWTYPLVRGQSAVLRTNYGGYMFPDLETGIEGSSVGLIFPDTVALRDKKRLELLLAELTTAFRTQEEVEEEYKEYIQFSGAIAEGLVKGAEVLGKGMVKGAVKTSELLFQGTDFAKQYIVPDTPKQVDPRLVRGLEVARVVSTGACKVSGWMVSKVGTATMALGRLLAPHLERGATHALTHLSGQSNTESSSQLKIVGEVASGTLAAVSTLYMALENSSKILAKNLANNTVMIVSHKYGADAAAVTDSALATAGNSYLTFYNAAALGPKGIAKRAAKDAGKAMVGFDAAAASRRAAIAPDRDIDLNGVVRSLAEAPNEKAPKYP